MELAPQKSFEQTIIPKKTENPARHPRERREQIKKLALSTLRLTISNADIC